MTRNLSSTELKRLHRRWRQHTVGHMALILDGVQGPFNIGSIIRTAAAQRVNHIWFAAGATTPDGNKVGKTALGSDRYLTWTVTEESVDAIKEAKAMGYKPVGVELGLDAVPLYEIDLAGDIALVLGHEERGLAKSTFAACDVIGFVPQLGKVGSLNVASAASIAMYEVRRQSWSR